MTRRLLLGEPAWGALPGFSRLPGVHLVRVPRDLDAITTVGREDDPSDGGLTRDVVESLWAAAVAVYRSGTHPGVQLCVRRHGAVVLNRAIGHAAGNGPGRDDLPERLMEPDTPIFTSSASKGVTAFLMLMLHERGQLDIFDTVATYIPEFAAHGKEAITLAQLLSHRAGVPQMPVEVAFDRDAGWDSIIAALCRTRPQWAPGEHLGYHALSAGYLLAEAAQRVTGFAFRDLLAHEILDPLGFRWTNYGVAPEDVPLVAHSYLTGPQNLSHWHLGRAIGAPFAQIVETSNTPEALTSVVPSGSIVSTAEEFSRFYEIFRRGGEMDGVRVVSPGTVRMAITPTGGLERDRTLLVPLRYGYGPMIGGGRFGVFGPDTRSAFGHLGFTANMAWADPRRALSASFLSNGRPLLGPGALPWLRMMRTVAAEVPTVPRADRSIWAPAAAPPRPHRLPRRLA